MSTPKAHARFAASSSDRWEEDACPRSAILSESCPPSEETDAAREGTTAHELMEFALNANIKDVVKFFENDCDERGNYKYSLDMRQYIQKFCEYVRSLMTKDCKIFVEKRIYLDAAINDEYDEDAIEELEAFGTGDVVIVNRRKRYLHVIDFKYGKHHVPHNDNSQMIYYALGVAFELNFDFDKIMTTIYQPRSVKKKHPARTATIGMTVLKEWQEKLRRSINLARDPLTPLKVGDYCFFCPVKYNKVTKISCPAHADKKFLHTASDFGDHISMQNDDFDFMSSDLEVSDNNENYEDAELDDLLFN